MLLQTSKTSKPSLGTVEMTDDRSVTIYHQLILAFSIYIEINFTQRILLRHEPGLANVPVITFLVWLQSLYA